MYYFMEMVTIFSCLIIVVNVVMFIQVNSLNVLSLIIYLVRFRDIYIYIRIILSFVFIKLCDKCSGY